ncbi:MAG: zinc metalloprotease HtpX [Geminicoccaceae bacterium]|nr:zinc metalloprotease HtpX [Geminicoccaceae bacterium]MCX7629098.1 zinc metalloprotease HtpX [Geminicoccaceae bacterium]MDW8125808.1 zinc metalloprotease HtpX [Geminicoccaceae bacterium]MDW8342602.1 zinc metalloprotease HtpX [Geminicoccaceae bacterium]
MNLFKTGLLLAAMTALFLAVGFLIGGEAGLVIAFVVALAMNAFAWWNSDKMVLHMHHAQPVTRASAPELWDLVAELARRARLPMPAVYVIPSDQPNAFATGRDPQHAAVAVTTGILETLPREELAGVIAHELAHIKNRDTLIMTIAATIAGAIGMLANFGFLFAHNRDDRQNPLGALGTLLVVILAPLAATLVQLAISRTREFAADRLGAQICGNPLWLAGALERIEAVARDRIMPTAEHHPATAHLFIVNPLRMGGIDNLFRTHPATEDRIAALLELAREMKAGPALGARPAPRRGDSLPRRRGSVPDSGGRDLWRRNPWNR